MTFSVTQNGKALDPSLYTWDEDTSTLSTKKGNLVLDFSEYSYCTFDTGSDCTFTTGPDCTFKTGSICTFNTGSYCTFDTGSDCTFTTGSDCTFDTGSDCTFTTAYECTFNTGSDCVIVRRDVFEIIVVPENKTIKLNRKWVKGYTIIQETKTIVIDGKDIEISVEAFNKLKKQLSS